MLLRLARSPTGQVRQILTDRLDDARASDHIRGVALTAAALAAVVALGLWSSFQDPGSSTLLVLAIGIVTASPVAFRLAQGRFDLFEPVVVFALAYGTMFVARPAAMIADNDYSFLFVPGLDVQPTFNRMLVLALLGAVCFVGGYATPFGKRLAELAPRPPRDFDRKTAAIAAVIVGGSALLLFFLFILHGGGLSDLSLVLGGRSAELQTKIATGPAYLFVGSFLLIGPCVLLFALYLKRKTLTMLLLGVAALAAVVVVRGSYGNRSALLPVLGGLFVYWFVSRRRRPRLVTSAIVIVLALIVSAGIYYGRQPQGSAYTTVGADYPAGFEKAVSSPGAALDPILKSGDAAMAPGLAAAMTIVPQEMSYGYGRYELVDLFSRWIPRGLWPAKPETPANQVTERLGTPYLTQGRPINLAAYSPLLDGYLDFGMLGALWLVPYGMLFRGLFEWFRTHQRSAPAMLVFSLGVALMPTILRDSTVDALYATAAIFLPVALAYALAGHRVAPS